MSYRSERFNKSMKSLEAMLSGYPDPSKTKVLCDDGKALERLMDALDYSPERERAEEKRLVAERLARQKVRLQRLSTAITRLVTAGKAHLVPTLLLIVRNGANRDKSTRLMSERSYRRHRGELCSFFGVGL